MIPPVALYQGQFTINQNDKTRIVTPDLSHGPLVILRQKKFSVCARLDEHTGIASFLDQLAKALKKRNLPSLSGAGFHAYIIFSEKFPLTPPQKDLLKEAFRTLRIGFIKKPIKYTSALAYELQKDAISNIKNLEIKQVQEQRRRQLENELLESYGPNDPIPFLKCTSVEKNSPQCVLEEIEENILRKIEQKIHLTSQNLTGQPKEIETTCNSLILFLREEPLHTFLKELVYLKDYTYLIDFLLLHRFTLNLKISDKEISRL